MSARTGARRAVAAIIRDLRDRRGLRQEWEAIDPKTVRQVILAWERSVREEFAVTDSLANACLGLLREAEESAEADTPTMAEARAALKRYGIRT